MPSNTLVLGLYFYEHRNFKPTFGTSQAFVGSLERKKEDI